MNHYLLQRRLACHGQALIELVVILLIVTVLAFGLIDFGRFLYQRQVLVNITREGSNLASRGLTLSNATAAVIASAEPLNINTRGRIIMTAVLNSNGVMRITERVSIGGTNATSRIGSTVGGTATLPSTPTPIPAPNQLLYVTEAFYSFQPITPIGRLLNIVLPSQIYDAAYF